MQGGGLSQRLLPATADSHMAPLRGEAKSHPASNSCSATGNDNSLVFKIHYRTLSTC